MIELRQGDWREVLAGETCDSLITDAPYSARTHEGQGDGRYETIDEIGYTSIDEGYCRHFVNEWCPRVRSWWVIFGDHVSNRWWLDALERAGLYVFAPVIWVKRGAPPRMGGDGPASQVEHLAVARPRAREFAQWGSLPGWYEAPIVHGAGVVGSKPENLMRALVRDYSRPGWRVIDPHAGGGTTLVAARAEGRDALGSEIDPRTHGIASARLAEPYARDLFARAAS